MDKLEEPVIENFCPGSSDASLLEQVFFSAFPLQSHAGNCLFLKEVVPGF